MRGPAGRARNFESAGSVPTRVRIGARVATVSEVRRPLVSRHSSHIGVRGLSRGKTSHLSRVPS
jgi:hypothetical protein